MQLDPAELHGDRSSQREIAKDTVFQIEDLVASYGRSAAIKDISFDILGRTVTAIIGPSGCGKSTFIRCLNRMNDTIPGFRTAGSVSYHGVDLYGSGVDAVSVRRRIGMVFQKPNPFPKSIYENVAFAL